MCFGLELSYPQKEFLNLWRPRTRTKYDQLPPHPTASSTRTGPALSRKAVRVPTPAP